MEALPGRLAEGRARGAHRGGQGQAARLPAEARRRLPEGFNVHPDGGAHGAQEAPVHAGDGEELLDWGEGEALAYATLLAEGYGVRLSGQDSERGTFSHRHAVLHDVKTGEQFDPLQQFATGRAAFQVFNSPLSEMGVLGFEYGYSLDVPGRPHHLGGPVRRLRQRRADHHRPVHRRRRAQVAAGCRGLTLLLPHGYEGQGPEHSSARLERFLSLCAEDNMQVCYPTTPAQIFHLLRRQVLRPFRKPLVIMSPKSLLRRREALSKLDELASGSFQEVIPRAGGVEPAGVTAAAAVLAARSTTTW